MDKSAKHFIDQIPPGYEVIKPLLAIVIVRHGQMWRSYFVAARSILIEMVKTSLEIDVDEFWIRLEQRMNQPPPKKIIYRLKYA